MATISTDANYSEVSRQLTITGATKQNISLVAPFKGNYSNP